ncbi:NADH-quinone oxidoreductase subunit M [Akkermansiaceae bacterium]|nr:NADH-quinone oxidoreductase subunit M [Akkermansiaceae bacterium]
MSILFVLIPLIGAILVLSGVKARLSALITSGATLFFALGCLFCWKSDVWSMSLQVLETPNIHLALGFPDGISVAMVLLSSLVLFAAVFHGGAPEGKEKLWYSSSLLIGAGAIGAFLSTDLFFFYAFHELALIPTFLMIGMLGKGDRKEAAWKITIYLAFGSIVLLAGLLWLVQASGAESWMFSDVLAGNIDPDAQKGIALLLIIGFGTLISLFPFHSWAAPAYAAAPTPVAMLHAGVLKKFGLYGLIRLYPTVTEGMQHWLGLLIVLLLGNILWVGFVTLNQKRLDSLLGNSSVMHMGYIFLALAALIDAGSAEANPIAIPGAVLLMFAHGISIAMLFCLADHVHKRTGSLVIADLGGLAKATPALAFFFGLAGMASIGLPGLANFSGEVLVFLSGFHAYEGGKLGCIQVATVLALWGVVISAVYMLRAFRKTFQGPAVPNSVAAKDLTFWEKLPALILAVALLVVGLYPNSLLNLLKGCGCKCPAQTEQADK